MLSYEEALDHLLATAVPVAEVEPTPLAELSGRYLAEALVSTVTVPPLDNSAMDGYAVRCADVIAAGVSLPVEQRIPAGSVGHALAAGTAARIFTGAPIPKGADAVVMQELCAHGPQLGAQLGDMGSVIVNCLPKPGMNIRLVGEDIAAGAEVLPAGTRLGAAEIGLAASIGTARLPVRRRLRVALLSTGDELAEPGQPLPPGGIYNSNRYFLRALLESLGCAVTDAGHVPDSLAETRKALRAAAECNDLIVTSGGVSVGEEDHVKPAVEAEGELSLWKIAIKPGKPLAYGKVGETAFIGLPGNPVSCFVTFLLFLRPYLLKRMGARTAVPVARTLVAASDWSKPDDRRSFLRARLAADGRVELYPNQGSGVLTSCAWADGLVDTPAQQTFKAGDPVRYLSFNDLQ